MILKDSGLGRSLFFFFFKQSLCLIKDIIGKNKRSDVFKYPIEGDERKLELWQQVLDKIQHKISKPSFDTWFSGTSAVIEDEVIKVMSKNEFVSDWLEERYKTLIFETVREVTNQTYKIEFFDSEGTSSTDRMRYSSTKDNDYEILKKLFYEQNDLLKKQQEKILELEKRIYQLEQNK